MTEPMAIKLCECGCGRAAPIARHSHAAKGHIAGMPVRFVRGHNKHGATNWRGGRGVRPDGYVRVWAPDHPRAQNSYVLEHIIVVEKALRRPLPRGPVVHHVNEIRSDNRSGNLVLCQDDAYHVLIHYRTRALRESGSASSLRCCFCKCWDRPENLRVPVKYQPYHRACKNKSDVAFRLRKKNGQR